MKEIIWHRSRHSTVESPESQSKVFTSSQASFHPENTPFILVLAMRLPLDFLVAFSLVQLLQSTGTHHLKLNIKQEGLNVTGPGEGLSWVSWVSWSYIN